MTVTDKISSIVEVVEQDLKRDRPKHLAQLYDRLDDFCLGLGKHEVIKTTVPSKGHVIWKAGQVICQVMAITNEHVTVRIPLHGRRPPAKRDGVQWYIRGHETRPNAVRVNVSDESMLEFATEQVELTYRHLRDS